MVLNGKVLAVPIMYLLPNKEKERERDEQRRQMEMEWKITLRSRSSRRALFTFYNAFDV